MIYSIDGGASVLNASATQTSQVTKKSSITPFEKVLKETEKETEVEKTTEASSGDTSTIKVPEKLKDIFERASKKYDVPYNFLVAIAKAESNFNVNAKSGAGAEGIMQLMPATAKSLGCDDPYDAESAIMAGAKYLASHLEAFDGDLKLAAAAYNAGGAAVRKYDGIPPYSETQQYVKTVMKYTNAGVSVPDTEVDTSVNAEKASETDFENTTVVVGSGDSAVTMTYGAYKRYLELGTTGVG